MVTPTKIGDPRRLARKASERLTLRLTKIGPSEQTGLVSHLGDGRRGCVTCYREAEAGAPPSQQHGGRHDSDKLKNPDTVTPTKIGDPRRLARKASERT